MNNTLYDSIINSSRALEDISVSLSNVIEKVSELNESFKELSGNSISDVFGNVDSILSIGNALGFTKEIMGGVKGVVKGTTSVFSGLIGIISNATPFLTIAGVITGVTTVIGGFCSIISNSTSKKEADIEKINAQSEAISKNTEEIKKNTDASIENVSSIEGDYSLTLRQIDDLVKLTGEGGYVGNIEKAKYLAEEINGVLPNSVKITEDNKVAWNGTTDAIKENIKALERKAIVEAYQKDYIEALKNQTKYEADLTAAKNAQKAAQDELEIAQEAYNENVRKGGTNVEGFREAINEAQKKLDAQNEALNEAEKQYAQNEKAINLYTNAYDALDGNVESSAKLLVEKYTEVGKMGTSTWESLGNALIDLGTKEQKHAENKAAYTEREIKENEEALKLIREQCVEKAVVFEQSYDSMIASLEKKGIVLSENEKTELKSQYDNYKNFVDSKIALQENGFEDMIMALEENGIRLNAEEQKQFEDRFFNSEAAMNAKNGMQMSSFAELKKYLLNSGYELTEIEAANLEERYKKWYENAEKIKNSQTTTYDTLKTTLGEQLSGMNSDMSDKLLESIDILAKNGSEYGIVLCQRFSNSLAANGGKVTNEGRLLIDSINLLAETADPQIVVGLDGPDASEMKNITQTAEKDLDPLKMSLTMKEGPKRFKFGENMFSFVVSNVFADGGFPDTGELFVAREAGPELVGRINGKTAVANNDQIVSGISSGVYNAVVGAMASARGSNTTVTAVFQVDGKQVAKQVIKAHNKEVMQTGRSPLLI